MTSQDNVYDCYPGTKSDSLWYNHMAVVVGYNDTIKTAHGRGAFLVLNSNTSLPGGLFYLDYNWFYFYQGNYPYYFLEENFNSNPEVSLRLSLSGIISSVDVIDNKHIFLEPSFNLSDC
jgi:C1A family cysteine protease